MVKYNKEEYLGKTKGIYTFLGMINKTKAIFKCELCGDKYEGNFYSWVKNGRRVCKCQFKNTHHKLYGRYAKMLARCYNPQSENFRYYGGRGIDVCKRWKDNFQNFLDDMQPSYFEGAELDRIDNNGNYEPQNCRWVTHSHNMLNRKGFKNSTSYPGVRITPQGNYLGRIQINKKEYRTKRHDNPEDAYNSLMKIKQRLYSEMNIEKPS
ncbi:hypothetical protein BU687_04840 [Staphylococcus chromogenes]|uniref:hypothetical protein n=1 Tax=Staphylococcus chromogenes TaxID=46126 RepID=UPI000D1A92F8|nr:hypothetical protein [Staphylococcus chromogenes]PTG04435.1 hypothetical protein BU666_02080 [Staphylococcus chromogenes]PTG53475.1 hypothetical protein BU687_04840 [Staphylococcus chromogenes]